MSNDFLFIISLVAVVVASFILVNRPNIIVGLLSIFLLLVFVPLFLYSAYVDYGKP